MLEKYQSFFSEDGITSTSANHLCNVARESIASAKYKLAQLSFVETSVNILGNNGPDSIVTKATPDIAIIEKCIDIISKANSFIAYMQEAIKAKDKLYTVLNDIDIKTYCKELGQSIPELPSIGEKKTYENFFNELSIKDKAHYYKVEAEASTIGKIIHPDGALHEARNQMFDAEFKPGIIKDDKIYHRKIVVDQKDVEEIFFNLQSRHRALEAELNAIKNSITTKVNEFNALVDSKYSADYKEYLLKFTPLQNEFVEWKNTEIKKNAKLKIAIPNSLKESYEYLSTLN